MNLNDTVKTFSDQALNAHSNTWLYISPFGAGLTNMLFIPKGAVILEITTHRRGLLYLRQALAIGHRYYGMETDNLKVNVEEIVNVVGAYIQERKFWS